MARTSGRRQRLRLFKSGNNQCPICLAPFTEQDAARGELVTLEHVPPKSFNVRGIPMCLTCADCNHSASCVEGAAIEAQRGPKVQLQLRGLPTQTAYLSRDREGVIDIRMSRPRFSQEAFDEALRAGRSFSLKFTAPTPHYLSVPWLKAAYLSVFSLLGVHGYRYAEGKAVQRVRDQIMRPKEEVIRSFAFGVPAEWRERDGILMNREQTPCWAVKMGDCFVLLPRSWDTSFYAWTDGLQLPGANIKMGGGPLWYPTKFAQNRVASIGFEEGYSPRTQIGDDLFGKPGRALRGDQVTPFVFADFKGQDATAIITDRLKGD